MIFKHEKTALGVYLGENAVGLIAYVLDDYDIWRLMIDYRFQKRGYGTQAMHCVMESLRNHGKLSELRTSAIFGENSPKPFYEKLGFRENGEVLSFNDDGTPNEVELVYPLWC